MQEESENERAHCMCVRECLRTYLIVLRIRNDPFCGSMGWICHVRFSHTTCDVMIMMIYRNMTETDNTKNDTKPNWSEPKFETTKTKHSKSPTACFYAKLFQTSWNSDVGIDSQLFAFASNQGNFIPLTFILLFLYLILFRLVRLSGHSEYKHDQSYCILFVSN